MKIEIIEKLGDGAFADVWRARDQLDREVAVKIIRPAGQGVSDALAHAKALARANHGNVVSVITLETIADPISGEAVDCVVMELIKGCTLAAYLQGGALIRDELKGIGLGIIDGVAHIHAQGMTHGDLHVENVMISEGLAKIIDILYVSTLASFTTEKRVQRVNRDIISVRLMLQELIYRMPGGTVDAAAFNNGLDANADLNQIRCAYVAIFEPRSQAQDARVLENVYARLTDPNFVKSVEYAVALNEETPESIVPELLEKLVLDKSYTYDHANFLRIVWARLSDSQKKQFGATLGQQIEAQTPNGRWFPLVRMLQTLGTGAWVMLPKITQIKLESMITKDVLAGYKDVFSVTAKGGGALGTYAVNLWTNFADTRQLALNLISMLHQSWYTQNYVATYFHFSELAKIADKTGTRTEFIQALASAIRNDAKVVKAKLEDLPDDWRAELL